MPDQPTQQLPPVQRLRIRYAKRGRLRFTSHRDFARAFERAVQRAAIPVSLSSGYSPHPRISYANASPTGAASEAEYLEIGLSQPREPDDVRAALDSALPAGLDVVDVVVASAGALAERLVASHWQVELRRLEHADVAAAVEFFLTSERVEVQRMTKRGLRTFDCRDAVVRMCAYEPRQCGGEGGTVKCAILDLVVRNGTPSVRPDDILTGLRELAGLVPLVPPLQTRLAQGPVDPVTGDVGDPLAPDRDASASVSDR